MKSYYFSIIIITFIIYNNYLFAKLDNDLLNLDSVTQYQLETKMSDYCKNVFFKKKQKELDLEVLVFSKVNIDNYVYAIVSFSWNFNKNKTVLFKFQKDKSDFIIEKVYSVFNQGLLDIDSILINKIDSKTYIELFFSQQALSSCKDQFYYLFEEKGTKLLELFNCLKYEQSYSYSDCGTPIRDDKIIERVFRENKIESFDFDSKITFDLNRTNEHRDLIREYSIKIEDENSKLFTGKIRYKYVKSKRRYISFKSEISQ